MDHDIELGKKIDKDEKRDAIHIAVAPVVAATRLAPAQRIGFVGDDHELVGASNQPIGIVDPFLEQPVEEGDRFWMLLNPYTITTLRHEWKHPAFATEEDKEVSRAWLHAFAAYADAPSYEILIEAAIEHRDAKSYTWEAEYLHFDGENAHGDIPPEFWDHVEVVTGVKIPKEKRARTFSCAC